MADINIVPLVDVVLVLLIIFMLTAHVMDFGLEVDAPKVRQVKESAEDLPVVTVTRKFDLYLNDKPVKLRELKAQIQRQFKDQNSVFVKADGRVTWNILAPIVAELSDAKLGVKLVTQLDESAGK
jgi:biopolymer transport protein ExbD